MANTTGQTAELQKLFIGDSTKPVEVVRSFKERLDSSLILELPGGVFAYPNGEFVTDPAAVEFLPKEHKSRALKFIGEGKVSCAREVSAGNVLMSKTKNDLAILAGVAEADIPGYSKPQMIEMIEKKAKESENA